MIKLNSVGRVMKAAACIAQAPMLLAAVCITASNAFAQDTATATPQAAQTHSPTSRQLSLFFREDWKNPPAQPYATPGAPVERWTREPFEHPVTQANVSNPNLELKLYGPSGKEILTAGGAGRPGGDSRSVPHLWTGLCRQTCAAALRDKSNYVDLSGFGKIRWFVRVSGLHRIHPIVKLADGTWLLGEHEDANGADLLQSEFTLSEWRWIKLDIDNVVTLGQWLETSKVDLTKVDEVGFTDLMPGSGHGDGGWMDMGWIEVYGKPVPRTSH